MAKLEEATARMFHNVFVCRNCKKKKRFSPVQISSKTAVCPKCGNRTFRPIKKQKGA